MNNTLGIEGVGISRTAVTIKAVKGASITHERLSFTGVANDPDGSLRLTFFRDKNGSRWVDLKDKEDRYTRWSKSISSIEGGEHLTQFGVTRPAKVDENGQFIQIVMPKHLRPLQNPPRKSSSLELQTRGPQMPPWAAIPDLIRGLNLAVAEAGAAGYHINLSVEENVVSGTMDL